VLLVDDDEPRRGRGVNTAERVPISTSALPLRPAARPAPLTSARPECSTAIARAGAALEAFENCGVRTDLRHQEKRLPAACHHLAHELEIDLGLAAAGHAVEEEAAKPSSLARTPLRRRPAPRSARDPARPRRLAAVVRSRHPLDPTLAHSARSALGGVRGAASTSSATASPSGRASSAASAAWRGARGRRVRSSRPAPSAASDRAATASTPGPDATAAAAPRRPPPRSGAGSSAPPRRAAPGRRPRAAARRPGRRRPA